MYVKYIYIYLSALNPIQRTNIINNIARLKTAETQGLCFELQLKKSAKYMMTVNINTADGLVNGATGILMDINFEPGSSHPKILWLLFSDENVGKETRRQKPYGSEPFWTPVEKCIRSFQFKGNNQICIERRRN